MSTQPNPKLTLQKVQMLILKNLSKSLNVSETEILIAIKQLGLNPNEIHENWRDAIKAHLRGEKPQALNGKPQTPKADDEAESFSIEDSEADFVDWDEVEEELGSGALALVEELGLEPEAITRSDLATLKELALINPVAEDMVNHIEAVGGLSGGLVDEYLRQQRDNAQALADAGNIEFAKTLLQGQIEGINQVVGLQNLLAGDFQTLIQQRIDDLGKRGKERPNELIKDLGKQATVQRQSSEKTTKVRRTKMDLVGLKSKTSSKK